jgi:DNA-binding MltR family transcriptional regulator
MLVLGTARTSRPQTSGVRGKTMSDRDDLTLVEYSKVVQSFHNETDRAATILAASFVDCFLEKLLKHFMVDDAITDELFKGHGPLATFAAKTDCAYSFGIINTSLHRELKFIRKIRNHFAHHPSDTSFDDSPVSEFCSELRLGGQQETRKSTYLISVGLAVGTMHNAIVANDKLKSN